jgi:hypothetical protein
MCNQPRAREITGGLDVEAKLDYLYEELFDRRKIQQQLSHPFTIKELCVTKIKVEMQRLRNKRNRALFYKCPSTAHDIPNGNAVVIDRDFLLFTICLVFA